MGYIGSRSPLESSAGGKEAEMEIGSLLVVALVVVLWIAAAVVGTDSRDGRDWSAPGDGDERRHRIGN
jgi:hypothetical protein